MNRSLSLLAHGILCLTLVGVIVAWTPYSPGLDVVNLDISWVSALNEAVARNMAFGREIVFTFGPYASVYTRAYHPATDFRMICGGLILVSGYAVVLVTLLRHAAWWKVILSGFLVTFFVSDPDMLFLFYPFIAAWLLSRFFMESVAETGETQPAVPRLKNDFYEKSIFVLVLIPFGLLPLIKGSLLVTCVTIIILLLGLLCYQRQWIFCILGIVVPAASAMVFWLLSGQPMAGLPEYMKWMIPVISGYTEAMAWAGPQKEIILYLLCAASGMIAVVSEKSMKMPYRIWQAALLGVTLFVFFKSSFVRHDIHVLAGMNGLFFAAWLLYAEKGTKLKFLFLVLSAAFCVWGNLHQSGMTKQKLLRNWGNTYTLAVHGIMNRIFDPWWLHRQYDAAIKNVNESVRFPLFENGVDIYAYGQIYLIAAGNRWYPRPVFQSYSVYTPSLAELNRQHLRGKNAPGYIAFALETIDGRFPSLDDGRSWPEILSAYVPVGMPGRWLVLQKKPQNTVVEKILMKTVNARIGESVPVPDTDGLVFAEISVQPSLSGLMMNTLYKNQTLMMDVMLQGREPQTFRVVSGMLASGFILSPFVGTTSDFALLYDDEAGLRRKVESLVLKSGGGWKNEYEIKFYHVPYPEAVDVHTLLPFNREIIMTESDMAQPTECAGAVDEINGTEPDADRFDPVVQNNIITLKGWLSPDARQGEVASRLWVTLSDADGKFRFFLVTPQPRWDVAAHFDQKALAQAGFTAMLSLKQFVAGNYRLGLAYSRHGKTYRCSRFDFPLEVVH